MAQNKIKTINDLKIRVEAVTCQVENWEKNFSGAWRITLFFNDDVITWERISFFLHEIGHVIDYRTNMLITNRNIINEEKRANKYAKEVAKLIGIPEEKIDDTLDEIIDSYRCFLKVRKGKTNDIQQLIQSVRTRTVRTANNRKPRK